MNGENSRNGLYERSGTETDGGKEEKRGLFSLFSGGGEGTGMKKIPLLLLLCGALGLFLILTGGDLPFFKKDDSPSSFSGANGKDEATLKAELTELLAGAEGVGKTEIYLTAGEDGRLQGIAVLCEGGEEPTVQKRVIGLLSALYGIGAHRIFVGGLDRGAAVADPGSAGDRGTAAPGVTG